jgi:hypothetical protein
MEPWAITLCDQCDDWQSIAESAEAAIAFVESEDGVERACA